ISLILLVSVLGFSGAAQQSCEVLGAQQAEIVGESTVLQRGMTLQSDEEIVTGSDGKATFLCADRVLTVNSNSQGSINEISESERVETNATVKSDVELSESLKQTDEMEKNLDAINQQVDKTLPGPLKSLILGDRVNFQVDNTTLGIKSNETAITGFEQGGVEDPTLEITMQENTIEEVLQSNNTMQSFSQAYDGEGIQVEAYSFRNKVVFGAVNIANKAYGFFSGLMN
ncbi:MAG: hypothetical protein V5A72_02165, partial [Candidatus Nanohaloarchaea archaeon]